MAVAGRTLLSLELIPGHGRSLNWWAVILPTAYPTTARTNARAGSAALTLG